MEFAFWGFLDVSLLELVVLFCFSLSLWGGGVVLYGIIGSSFLYGAVFTQLFLASLAMAF